jgi:predicted transcriptional regulator
MAKKKEGKIAKAYRLKQEGLKVKEIAAKMKLSERIVRAYIWRAKNPEKYKALLNRYREKKKTKQESAKNKPEEKN